MEDKLKKFVEENREEFDTFIPSDEVWNRLQQRIEKKQGSSQHIIKMKTWLVAASVVAVLSIVALSVFRQDRTEQKPEEYATTSSGTDSSTSIKNVRKDMQIVAVPKTPVITESKNFDKSKVKRRKPAKSQRTQERIPVPTPSEVDRNMLALLNDSESATNRMKGVLEAQHVADLSPEILEKIQHTIVNDPNSNVRFAALELFMDNIPVTEREQKLQELFIAQTDVALQMELMQVFNQNDSLYISTATVEKLQEIATDPLAIDVVKDQAYAVLMKTW